MMHAIAYIAVAVYLIAVVTGWIMVGSWTITITRWALRGWRRRRKHRGFVLAVALQAGRYPGPLRRVRGALRDLWRRRHCSEPIKTKLSLCAMAGYLGGVSLCAATGWLPLILFYWFFGLLGTYHFINVIWGE